ncbi:MAG: hypothetical protein A2939_00705 [Parcubacteria group bacterium RIFCSPLOWO2_01_FULL_48_18]|nr:MAG: hypothetical protein A2939_00705 [Parcubacteria group bacterium RIFCSPLOWO2_01_FULL_48_18]
MNRKLTFTATLAALSVFTASCADNPTEPENIAIVIVSPQNAQLSALGESTQLTAQARDRKNNVVSGAIFSWASSDTNIVSINQVGLTTARGNGPAVITAAAGTVSGRASIEVNQQAAGITLTPRQTTLFALGDTLRFIADARDANGNPITDARVNWFSPDDNVATIDETGLATARGNGTVTVRVTAGSASAQADLTVTQRIVSVALVPEQATIPVAGDTLRLTAYARDANNYPVTNAAFTWNSSDPAVATVDQSGLVTAQDAGTTTITADANGVYGSSQITVPEQDWIAFWRTGDYADECGGYCENIYMLVAGSNRVLQITAHPGQDFMPSWFSDGKHLAFGTTRDGDNAIYVINADGSSEHRIQNGLSYSIWPAVSPDGLEIAFVYTDYAASATGIAIMNSNGANVRKLTSRPCSQVCKIEGKPTWSPDGAHLTFDSPTGGNRDVYVINKDGTALSNLTRNPNFQDWSAAWSPDGTRIAFVSDRSGTQEIYVMNADGTNPQQLTDLASNEGGAMDPTWSPDGKKIIFASNHTGNLELFTINSYGPLNLQNVTNTPHSQERYPDWRR